MVEGKVSWEMFQHSSGLFHPDEAESLFELVFLGILGSWDIRGFRVLGLSF